MKPTNNESTQLHAGLALETVNRSQKAIRQRHTRLSPVVIIASSLCLGATAVFFFSHWSFTTKAIGIATMFVFLFAIGWWSRRAIGVRPFAPPMVSSVKFSLFCGLFWAGFILSKDFLFQRFGENAIWLIGAIVAIFSLISTSILARQMQQTGEEFAQLPMTMQKDLSKTAQRSNLVALLRYGVGLALLLATAFWLAIYLLQDGSQGANPWGLMTIISCLSMGLLLGGIPFLVVAHRNGRKIRAQMSALNVSNADVGTHDR